MTLLLYLTHFKTWSPRLYIVANNPAQEPFMEKALIIGAGPGLSASVARLFKAEGMTVALAARSIENLASLSRDVGAQSYLCDATDEASVTRLFTELDKGFGTPDVIIHNVGYYTRGPITEVSAEAVQQSFTANAYSAFLVAQQGAKRMQAAGKGALFFTGASAGVKGYAQSAPFAMGKFALRGLCQSLARELAPQNIHVAHFVIDGMIYAPERGEAFADPAKTLHPDSIAKNYLAMLQQDPSAWTWEQELRPSSEVF